MSNPALNLQEREKLVQDLMKARRTLAKSKETDVRKQAREAVDKAKRALGERGTVWWTDGAPDYNRFLVQNSPYADWYASLLEQNQSFSE